MPMLDRHKSDVYGGSVKPIVNYGSIKSLKLVDELEIGKTDFKEVLEKFGNVYKLRMTMEPLYRRKYKNKYYLIKYILLYYHYNHVHDRDKKNIALFFDQDEKLAFFYLSNDAYPKTKEYHNIPEETPKEEKRLLWPYAKCDKKYYQKISNPVLDFKMSYDKDRIKCEWEKEFEKEIPK